MRLRIGLPLVLALCSAKVTFAVDFVKEIQPLLETNCVSCHRADKAEGELRLDNLEAALKGGASGDALVPNKPDDSLVYTYLLEPEDSEQLMPPKKAGGPLRKTEIELIKTWIKDGAVWPKDITLTPKAKNTFDATTDTMELVEKIHAHITKTAAAEKAEFANYASKVPQTGAGYEMIAIKEGEFLMGSPPTEAKRQENEGPQVKVKVDAFWMGKCEVTWDEYEPFMITKPDRRKNGSRIDFDPAKHTLVDAVSQPTGPYTEMSFGMGQKGFPAISMTQHAANKYCQWLSAQTGHFYRLPTEAEWEYACLAGTTTAYSFGDDPAQLKEYAWFYKNSSEKYQKVGIKKPNPWGLYDMHGNVMEWTTDQFYLDYFSRIKDNPVNPLMKPEKLYPVTVRGGGWDDDADKCRSAIRRGSAAEWKQQDPQLPKSIWYHTDAQWLGFRIIRPKEIPSAEEMYFYWNSAAGKL